MYYIIYYVRFETTKVQKRFQSLLRQRWKTLWVRFLVFVSRKGGDKTCFSPPSKEGEDDNMFYSIINSQVSSAVGKMRTRFIRTQTGLSENILCCEHRAPDQTGSSMDALALYHLLNRLMNWNPRLLTTKTLSLCILLCESVYVHERRKRFDEFCVSHFFSQCAQSVSLPKTRHYIIIFSRCEIQKPRAGR